MEEGLLSVVGWIKAKGRIHHNLYGIRADEPADGGIVETGIVEVQAGLIQPLTGEPLVGVEDARGSAGAPEGEVVSVEDMRAVSARYRGVRLTGKP
jgi:hypothetical protein